MESFLSISQAISVYTNLGPVPEIFVRSYKYHAIVMFREAFYLTIIVAYWSKGWTISYEHELHAFRQNKLSENFSLILG